jgi:hypothetical protein
VTRSSAAAAVKLRFSATEISSVSPASASAIM